ncbi:hypothetical protein M8C21_031931 [Ambrosia artemisiifolia]|uniref:Uncharacterized protein n=1 Tax=Ambrosia artemisiifolia TaxID=4212 RepID=A0AAD5C2W3_AMBAR|nr:hypothetical protein M8C21_031931 [Ambrosia artemisiifolia]
MTISPTTFFHRLLNLPPRLFPLDPSLSHPFA